MQWITKWLPGTIAWPRPGLGLGPLPACLAKRLDLSPQEFPIAINARVLANWALMASRW